MYVRVHVDVRRRLTSVNRDIIYYAFDYLIDVSRPTVFPTGHARSLVCIAAYFRGVALSTNSATFVYLITSLCN